MSRGWCAYALVGSGGVSSEYQRKGPSIPNRSVFRAACAKLAPLKPSWPHCHQQAIPARQRRSQRAKRVVVASRKEGAGSRGTGCRARWQEKSEQRDGDEAAIRLVGIGARLGADPHLVAASLCFQQAGEQFRPDRGATAEAAPKACHVNGTAEVLVPVLTEDRPALQLEADPRLGRELEPRDLAFDHALFGQCGEGEERDQGEDGDGEAEGHLRFPGRGTTRERREHRKRSEASGQAS